MKNQPPGKATGLYGSQSLILLPEHNELHSPAQAVPVVKPAEPRLSGDLGVWLVILLELLTFAILFISFAFARLREVELFNASQRTLNLQAGALNTVLLITASWCVACAVRAVRRDASAQGARWLVGAIVCGCGFVLLKLTEYADKLTSGIDLSSNTFYTFYFMLTGFHFLHVVVGILALAYLWFKTRRGDYGSHDCHALETGGAFWHMVDLLWIVLFPLVYVMR
ncbi:cytochrome c oxidase subunit 3 family protein [Simplicispira psychrophila]|uniref:cytochrome c oxidase subunit 3 family protein n=1 Tax=Simplicispira psychrophila TaxID=80882 RepID=UPI000A05923B|nr:cytochrome c oxidase subunit 3 family protein [Simplicispira psychrophila]